MAVFRDRVNIVRAASRIESTPQGYLWCRDVPLARTGTMDYAPGEVPGLKAAPGQRTITVERTADEVFSPESIASFRGMPLTDDHPADFVFAHNHRQHSIGEIHDPRRGEGEHADCLVADILVKDPDAVALIKSRRKRELSCGYDADYTDVRPGYGRQINIRGNHVSLVDAGRAGPRIAIRDRLMATKPKPARRRAGMLDAIFAAFRSDDPEVAAKQRRALDEAMGEPEPSGDGPMVVVHAHAPPEPKELSPPGEGKEPAPEEGKGMDEDQVKAICGSIVAEALAPWGEKIDALIAATKAQGEQVAAVTEAVETLADPNDMEMQDAVARAAVLVPDMKMPARDAKPGTKAHNDAVVALKRDSLRQALATPLGAEALAALGIGSPHQIAALPAVAVDMAFKSASQRVYDHNTMSASDVLSSAQSATFRDDDGKVKPLDGRSWNKINADFFGRKA